MPQLDRIRSSAKSVQKRPLLVLAALVAAAEPDLGKGAIERLKASLRERYKGDPIGSTATAVLLASWLFYRAERGKNPKVNSFVAAAEYITSSLSVGYTDIYPKTQAGKAIASTLMTFGPAMAANIFEQPREATAPSRAEADPVVERLDRILALLEARSAG
jgi:hypothetical protein